MNSNPVVYLSGPGKKNTDAVIESVVARLDAGGIRHVVIASSTGATASTLVKAVGDRPVKVVVVTSHCGFEEEGESEMSRETIDQFARSGVTVVRASHILSGIERSLTRKFGGASRVEAIAEALRSLFGQGMKVCVEVAVMAADNGAIPTKGEEVIAIGGSGSGADTACVVRPAHANAFFSFEVREILAMPRVKRKQRRK